MIGCVLPWVAAALLATPPHPAQEPGEPPLFPGACYHVGGWDPWALAVADFNGDGLLDVVTVNHDTDDLTILLGDGHGRLGQRRSFPVQDEPTHLVTGDFDEDGAVDVAVISGNTTAGDLLVLFGDGGGGLSAPRAIGPGGIHLCAADVDLDGHLDLVHPKPWPQGDLVVRLGDGKGRFAAPAAYATGLSTDWVALGDLDGDLFPDAAVVDDFGTVLRLMKGGRGGTFAPMADLAVPNGVGFVRMADLDSDGDLDLLGTKWSAPSQAVVILGDGQGGFGPATGFDTGLFCEGASAGDLDGDGDVDIVAWLGSVLSILLGDGSGTFGPPAIQLCLPGGTWTEIADLDRDGHADLLSASEDGGEVAVVTGLGDGTFLLPVTIEAGSHPTDVAALDFDADGDLDLAVTNAGPFGTNSARDVWLLEGDGSGGFATLGFLTAGDRPVRLIAADLDADGRPDLCAASSDSQDLSVFLAGEGGAPFGPARRSRAGCTPRDLLAADLDRDGRPELVTVGNGPSGGVLSVTSDLAGGLSGTTASIPTGPLPSGLQAADLDRDGWVDLVVACQGESSTPGALWIHHGSRSGAQAVPTIVDAGPRPIDVVVVDLSRDGALDLVVLNNEFTLGSQHDHVSVLLGDGAGGWSEPVPFPLETHGFGLTCGDVDGDGLSDVVAWNDELMAVLRGDGRGGLGAPELFQTARGSSLCLGDLNGDARPDLALSGYYLEGLTLHFNRLPGRPACSAELVWCSAKPNSQGCLPRICSSGTPGLSGPDDFVVSARQVLGHQIGLLAWSLQSATLPFAGGTVCVGSPAVRARPQLAAAAAGVHGCSGTYSFAFTQGYMQAHGLSAGTRVFAQYWSRDPYLVPPYGFGLTDALAFLIAP